VSQLISSTFLCHIKPIVFKAGIGILNRKQLYWLEVFFSYILIFFLTIFLICIFQILSKTNDGRVQCQLCAAIRFILGIRTAENTTARYSLAIDQGLYM